MCRGGTRVRRGETQRATLMCRGGTCVRRGETQQATLMCRGGTRACRGARGTRVRRGVHLDFLENNQIHEIYVHHFAIIFDIDLILNRT
jgi:hypothetical protein